MLNIFCFILTFSNDGLNKKLSEVFHSQIFIVPYFNLL